MRLLLGLQRAAEPLRLSARGAADTLFRSNRDSKPDGAHSGLSSSDSPHHPRSMAKSQFKAGGPTRGRLRVRKMGMGSGAAVAKLKAKGNSKGKKRG